MRIESLGLVADRVTAPRANRAVPDAPACFPACIGGSAPRRNGHTDPDRILRFRKSERRLHWAIAVPYMLCYATAAILMFGYNLHSPGVSRDVFSWIHRGSGVCLILLPTLSILRHAKDYRVYLHNIRQAWVWNIDDLKWIVLFGASVLNRRIKLPEQGKFNAAEKVNFMVLTCTYPAFILTGLLLCLPGTRFFAWIGHVGMALLVTPLIAGHIFMALINPDTRVGLAGMFSGYVDRTWARHHYGRWYREHFENMDTRAGARPALVPRSARISALPVKNAAAPKSQIRAAASTAGGFFERWRRNFSPAGARPAPSIAREAAGPNGGGSSSPQ